MSGLIVIVGSVLNAVIIGFFARRLLGVPVGWPRTIALSLVVNSAMTPLIDWALQAMQLHPVTDQRFGGVVEVLIVTLIVLWALVLEVVALAVLEALGPTGTVPNPLALVRALPARARRGSRYAAILRIAAKHGLTAYFGRRPDNPPAPASKVPRSVREAFTEGGVTFVKLGQMLSTRADLLPPAYIEELSRLHSDVPPEPWLSIRPVIEAQLGGDIDDTFAAIDPQPIAAASIAQIHAAQLRDGREVVIKVQRPRARAQVTADLDIVARLARALDRRAGWARALGVTALAQGFADSLAEELDYRIELANMQAITAASADLRVPHPLPELSGRHVLVMDRVPGRPLSAARASVSMMPADQRARMAERLFTTVLRQILVTGVFHADLHPGNIFVDDDGTLALLDFGSVGRLDQAARTSLSTLLMAVDRQDAIAATDSLTDLLDAPADLDHRLVEREVGQIIMRYSGGVGSGGGGPLFADLFKIVIRHDLAVPPAIAAAFRALGALDGSLSLLTDDMDLVAVARAQGQQMMSEKLAPGNIRGAIDMQLAACLPMVQRLPRRINRLTADLESGSFTVGVRVFEHPADRAFLTNLVQQVVVALLAAALALGGVLLLIADTGPLMTPGLRLFTFLGALLLLFAFVLGSRALVLVFRPALSPQRRQ